MAYQELIKIAVEHVREKDGYVSPYRIASYLIAMCDVSPFFLMAEVREYLGSPEPVTAESIFKEALSHRYPL